MEKGFELEKMNEDEINFETSHGSELKRSYESFIEDDIEDDLFSQLHDILACENIKINQKLIVIMEPHIKISDVNKFYCKILKFTSDWKHPDLLSKLNSLNRIKYSNVIVFIIDITNADFEISERPTKKMKSESPEVDEIMKAVCNFVKDRPIFLQLTSIQENRVKFYYKDGEVSKLTEVDLEVKTDIFSDFSMFLEAASSGVINNYIDSVFLMIEGKYPCSLILRFLRILEVSEEVWSKLILKCAECGSLNELFAALDVPFGSNGKVLSSTAEYWLTKVIQEKILAFEEDPSHQDKSDVESQAVIQYLPTESSVLHKSIQFKNKDVIDCLITYCTHLIQQLPIEHQIKISSTAYHTQQFDVMHKLINLSDFPFPGGFSTDGIENEELLELVKERENLMIAIDHDEINLVKSFVDVHSCLKIAYSPNHVPALLYSIITKKFEVFLYLKLQGFLLPEFKNHKDVINEDVQKTANEFMLLQRERNINQGLTDQQKYVNILCNKSIIHNRATSKENELNYRAKIRKWFEDIYKIEKCIVMLNIAASFEDLKIIFDFESITVNDICFDDSGSFGMTKASKKWIFIGAELSGDTRDQEIKGTLAHEICHFVMYLVYENKAVPYYKHQTKIKERFIGIAENIIKSVGSQNDECDGIISTVLKLNDKSKFLQELIVRPVHILAHFDNNSASLNNLQSKYNDLFSFWIQVILPELQNFNHERREYVRKMNRTAKLLLDLKSCELNFKLIKELKLLLAHKITIVISNVPKLLLINIYKYLQSQHGELFDTENIFICPKTIFNNPEIFNDFNKLIEENSELNIFIDCSTINKDIVSLNIKSVSRLVFVVQSYNQAKEVNEYIAKLNSKSKELEINYSFNDLTLESQEKLLQTKINFQNNSQITLLDLITKDINDLETQSSKDQDKNNNKISSDILKIIDDKLLNLLVEAKEIKMNEIEEDSMDFRLLYQPRNFQISYSSFSENEIFIKVKNHKYVLLSDIAGNGKSWAIKSISNILRNQNPTKWVTCIDLKQLTIILKTEKDNNPNFLKFFVDKVFKFNNKYEAEIFKRMYEIGKVFILFDGFDEIAPNYAEFVLKLAKSFEQNEGNQLWISTRDFFKVNLQNELQVEQAYSLGRFSIENGAEFIAKSWMLSEPEINKNISKDEFEKLIEESTKYKKFLEIAQKIIQKFSVSRNQSIGMPQIYKMIAEITNEKKESAIDFSQAILYKTLVQKLYDRWASGKGEIWKQSSIKSQEHELSFYRFHQYLAIKSLFHEYIEVFFAGYNPIEWKIVEIAACGIVVVKNENDEYEFIHETFREYFVADFIAKELNKTPPRQEVLDMFAEVMTTYNFEIIRMFLSETLESSNHSEIEPEIQTSKQNKYTALFSKFQKYLFKYSNSEFLTELVTKKAFFLHLIRSDLSFESFEIFYLEMESKIGSETVKIASKLKIEEEGNIFFFLCESPDLCVSKFKNFLNFLSKQLSVEETKDLMLNIDKAKTTIIQYILFNLEDAFEYWNEIRNFFIKQEKENFFKELLTKEDSEGGNIFMCTKYLSFDNYQKLLNQMFEMFDNEVLKKMFMKVDLYINNFMHLLIKGDTKDLENIIEYIFMIFIKKFNNEYLKELLELKNINGQSVLEMAIKRGFYNCQIYKIIWQNSRETCKSDDEFLKIINKNKSRYSENIFQVVAQNDSACKVLEIMIQDLEKLQISNESKILLGNRNLYGKILLTELGLRENCFELFKKLWKIYGKNFDLVDFLKIGLNFLSDLIHNGKMNFIEHSWKEIKLLKNQDDVKIIHYLRLTNWDLGSFEQSSKTSLEANEWMNKMLQIYKIEFEIKVFPMFYNKFELCIQSESDEDFYKLLIEYKKEFECENLSDNLKYLLMTPNSKGQNFLFRSIFCKNVNFTRILWQEILNISNWSEVKSLQNNKSYYYYIIQMFRQTDCYKKTILHEAAEHSTSDILQLLFEVLEAIATTDEIKEILSYRSFFNDNLLHLAIKYNKSLSLHEILWEFFIEHFEQNEMIELTKNDFSDTFKDAVESNTREIVELIWEKYKKLLNRSDQVKYLVEQLNNLDIFMNINDQHKHKIQIGMKNIIIQYPDIFLHLCESSNASKEPKYFLKNLQKYLQYDEISSFLENCNNDGENIFHILVRTKKSSELVKWLDGLSEFFTSSDISHKFDELFTQRDFNDNSFLYLSVFNDSIEFHQTIWNFLKDFLTVNGIFTFCVNENDRNRYNFILKLVLHNKNPEIVNYIFNILKTKLSKEKFKKLLSYRGDQGKNLLQSAIINKNIKVFKIIWKILIEFYNSDLSKKLSEVDDFDRNILEIAVCFSSGEHFNLLVNHMVKIFRAKKFQVVFFNIKSVQNLLNYAICNNSDLTLHKALWKRIKKLFNNLEIKNIIFSTDQFGNNLLHNLVLFNCKQIAEFIWSQLKNFLNVNEQGEYLNATGYEGKKLKEMPRENKLYPDIQEWINLMSNSNVSCTTADLTNLP